MKSILTVADSIFLHTWRVFYEIPPREVFTLRWWFYLLWGTGAWCLVFLLFLLFVFLPLYDAIVMEGRFGRG